MIQASISSEPSLHGAVNFSQSEYDLVRSVTGPVSVASSGGWATVACAVATVPPAAENEWIASGPLVSGWGALEPSAASS
jgi:hypothetical protein